MKLIRDNCVALRPKSSGLVGFVGVLTTILTHDVKLCMRNEKGYTTREEVGGMV